MPYIDNQLQKDRIKRFDRFLYKMRINSNLNSVIKTSRWSPPFLHWDLIPVDEMIQYRSIQQSRENNSFSKLQSHQSW